MSPMSPPSTSRRTRRHRRRRWVVQHRPHPAVGNNVLVITSTAPGGGTAQIVRSVVNDVVNGTLLFTSDDPTGDDNGPGNYAYPTVR